MKILAPCLTEFQPYKKRSCLKEYDSYIAMLEPDSRGSTVIRKEMRTLPSAFSTCGLRPHWKRGRTTLPEGSPKTVVKHRYLH